MDLRMFWNIVLVLVLFFLLTSLWGFYTSIKPPKIISTVIPKDLGLVYEQVTFTTRDGLALSGWFVPNEHTRVKTVVLLHGYPADKGDILPALSFLHEKFNLFLFDFRYFGQSEGAYSTIGAKETVDLAAAIQYLKMRGIDEVGVWGFSMGGAVALMAAAEIPGIKVVVSESSYARLDLMAPELYRIPLIKYPLAKLTLLWAKLFLGINAREASPVESVKNLNTPILLIHSTNDEVISFKHAALLQEALKNNPKTEFWFQENLVHGQLDEKYQKRIEGFFQRNL